MKYQAYLANKKLVYIFFSNRQRKHSLILSDIMCHRDIALFKPFIFFYLIYYVYRNIIKG